MSGHVYLLHLEAPLNADHPQKPRHYLGYSDELQARLNAHHHGHGARFTQVARQRGIDFELVRAWKGNKADEKYLKRQHNSPRYCPLCNERPLDPGLPEVDLWEGSPSEEALAMIAWLEDAERGMVL